MTASAAAYIFYMALKLVSRLAAAEVARDIARKIGYTAGPEQLPQDAEAFWGDHFGSGTDGDAVHLLSGSDMAYCFSRIRRRSASYDAPECPSTGHPAGERALLHGSSAKASNRPTKSSTPTSGDLRVDDEGRSVLRASFLTATRKALSPRKAEKTLVPRSETWA